MTTKINGTNTAASPAITGADTDTGLSFASDTVNINTGGTTRATVDSSGRLLLGTTTEGNDNGDDITIGGSGAKGITIRSTDSSNCHLYFSDATSGTGEYAGYIAYQHSNDSLQFGTGTTERMRIKSDGNTVIDSGGMSFAHLGQFTSTHDGSRFGMAIHNTNTGGGSQIAIRFHRANTDIGSISTTGSATAYNTSSDYRLKENAVAISDGITRLKTLKPYRFNWKSDPTTTVDGFFAHEVTAVPEAITGIKDAIATEDEPQKGIKKDDPIYQSIDQSKLVPLLTSALQEAITKIETLETKVAALEAA